MPTIDGQLDAKGLRFALVQGRFNEQLTERLLEGARDCLVRHGAREEDLVIVRVPGAFEIPQAAKRLADSGRFAAIIGLGVVLRGETLHFELLSHQACAGLMQVGVETGVPVAFGVVTANTLEQAIARCGTKSGNKGWEAAIAAIEMADLYRRIETVE